MIFYHFTQAANVPLIAVQGLKPDARGEHAFMSNGIPVVWLTLQESNRATAEHVAHIKEWGGGYEVEEGGLLFGGPARLTVNVERHNKRLKRFADFLRWQESDLEHFSKSLPPGCFNKWWVFVGEIPPHKIEACISAALAMECLNHHVSTHPDAGARERFANMRERVAKLAPDTPVKFAFPKWGHGDAP